MNRQEYEKSRRLYRDNGRYALRWMDESARLVFQRLHVRRGEDWLEERADMYRIFRKVGIHCDARNTRRFPE